VLFRLNRLRFRLDPDRLRKAFSRSNRAIIINSPTILRDNVLDREELDAIAKLCIEFDTVRDHR